LPTKENKRAFAETIRGLTSLFLFAEKNGSCRFSLVPFAEFQKRGDMDMDADMESWRHGGMGAWRHGGMEAWRHGGMEAWRHGDIKQKTEALEIFLYAFTICSLCEQKFVVCLFVNEETNGSYPFANGLNGLAHL
jgi:hypothetical protein